MHTAYSSRTSRVRFLSLIGIASLAAATGCSKSESSAGDPTDSDTARNASAANTTAPRDQHTDSDADADNDERSSLFSIRGSRERLGTIGRRVGSELGDQLDSAMDHAGDAKSAVFNLADSAVDRAKQRAKDAQARLASLVDTDAARGYLDAMTSRFGEQLDRLGDIHPDGSTYSTVTTMVLRSLPVLGKVDKYADARALYAKYQGGADEHSAAMRQVAKRQCLMLFIQIGFDITLLGLPSALEMPVELADRIVDSAVLVDKTRKLVGDVAWVSFDWNELSSEQMSLTIPALDRALSKPRINATVIEMLTMDFSKSLFE